MTTPATFQTRVSFDHVRNTAAGFTTANPVLGYGVIGLETDSGKIKVGNGTTAWSSLPYSGGGPVEWSAITGKPSTFTPATHTHAIADVTGLQTALDAKATPADVTAAVSSVIDAAPAALDTLNELAAALGDDANFASTVTTALSAKAPLASPTFTGTVSGVTKAMVGLGNVDNTSDASKPISTATQTALDAKAAATHTHVIADVTGLQTALDGKQAAGSYASYDQSLNTTDAVTFDSVSLPNATQITVGSFDNSTGGASGLSLICAVGYELNWQGGRLKNVYNNATQTIHVDSPIQFHAGVLPKIVALGTGGGSMPTDASLGEIFTATADANTLIENPTNPVDGKTIRWKLSQDATGGRVWTLGTKFNIPSSASSPLPWSTAANKTDLLAATYDAGRDEWDIIAFVPGY